VFVLQPSKPVAMCLGVLTRMICCDILLVLCERKETKIGQGSPDEREKPTDPTTER